MAADENRVFALLGMLQNQMSNLDDKVEKFQEKSTEEHRKVHDIVVATSESIRVVARDVAEMKPQVEAYKMKAEKIDEAVDLAEDYKEKRAEARGAARFANALYIVGGGSIVAALTWLKDLLTTRPHPIVAVLLLVMSSQALAHDSWISRGGLKNGAGEWCCGEGDCALMDLGAVQAKPYGYVVYGHGTIGEGPGAIRTKLIDEIVPYSEAQPSPDGRYWRCKRPDGTRRCFFAPPPNS